MTVLQLSMKLQIKHGDCKVSHDVEETGAEVFNFVAASILADVLLKLRLTVMAAFLTLAVAPLVFANRARSAPPHCGQLHGIKAA